MARFSDMLLYLRKRDNLTQAELADKLTEIGEAKITRSAVGMWEAGQRVPKLEVLETIADFFNINMDTLTGGGATAESAVDPLPQITQDLFKEIQTLSLEEQYAFRELLHTIKANRREDK